MLSTFISQKQYQISTPICWNREEVSDALGFLVPQQDLFLNYLTELINSYHGWHKSAVFYDLVCGAWLMHFSHVIYAAYIDVVRRGVGVSGELSPIFIFSDYGDYRWNVNQNVLFSDQLRQYITRVLDRSPHEDLQFRHKVCTIGSGIKQPVSQRVYRSVSVCKKNTPFLICRPYTKCTWLEWQATRWKWRNWARQDDFYYPIEVTTEIDDEWRRQYSADIVIDDFSELVRALLPLYIPVVYLEAFSVFQEKAKSLNLHRPKVIYTANALHGGDSLFNMLAANWREEGTKLLNHQHGGGYGIDRIHPLEMYETRVADRFYTLGWQGLSPKQIPLVGAMSESQWRLSPESKRVLLSCVSYSRQVNRIHFQPMPGTIETMIAETVNFVREMKGTSWLQVRPYTQDYGWRMVETLLQVDPTLRLDDIRVPGLKSYARSALVVHNYLGTSLFETLVLNIPTICFYNKDTYAFRDSVQPYIDNLIAVGILHQRGADAARFVLDVTRDPQDWWRKPDVQAARQAFVYNYANYSADWAIHWEAEFRQWIE